MSGTRTLRRLVIALLLAVGLLVPATSLPAQAAGTGTVSGTVSTPGGRPIEGAYVSVNMHTEWGWSYLGGEYTDAEGSYTFPDLEAGDYYLEVYADGHLSGYSDGATETPADNTGEAAFTVADGAAVTQDITLPFGEGMGEEQITGTITEPGGSGIGGAGVELWYWNESFAGWGYTNSMDTDTDGAYAFNDLPTGDYYLRAYHATHEERFYGGGTSAPEDNTGAGVFTVVAGTPFVADVELPFQAGAGTARVHGTVTGNDGPLADAYVSLLRWNAEEFWFDWVDSIPTDANGAYEFTGLGAGDYYLEFSADQHDLAYSNGATDYPEDDTSAAVFPVADDGDVTQNAELSFNPNDGGIRGRVTDGTNPLEGFEVSAYPATSPPGSAPVATYYWTDTDGAFELWLDPGTYRLELVDQQDSWADARVEDVVVESEQETLLDDVVATPAGTATIRGSVVDAAEDADVTVHRVFGTPGTDSYYTSFVGHTEVAPDGTFAFDDLRVGRRYTFSVWDPRYGFDIFVGGTFSDVGADTIVADGDDTLSPIVLPEPGSVTGTVNDASGPVSDVRLQVYRWDEGGGFQWVATAGYTDENGGYQAYVPGPGRYTLRFDPTYSSSASVVTWLNGADTRPSASDAAGTFGYPGNATTAALGAVTLRPAFHATGTVTIAGAPASGAEVTAYLWEDGYWDNQDLVEVDEDGSYRLRVRDGATYTFEFGGPGYVTRFLGGGSGLPDEPTSENSLTVAGEDLAVPTQAMTPTGRVTGTVSDGTGPVTDASVSLYQWDETDERFYGTGASVGTDDTGAFSLPVPGDGRFTLAVEPDYDSLFETTWLNGTKSRPTTSTGPGTFGYPGDELTSPVGEVVLVPALRARGTVTDGTGAALPGAEVTTYRWDEESEEWYSQRTVGTGSDGTYAVRVAPEGTHTIRVTARGYSGKYLGGGSTLPAAPAEGNSFTMAEEDKVLPTVSLVKRPTALGTVAGQNYSWCRTHTLEDGIDASSDPVTIPFPLRFFGDTYTELYVNDNGNLSFGTSNGQYTPEDLTGNTGVPLVAPFYADVDTSSLESGLVTYGSSPDDTQFCATWHDVGYYYGNTEKVNTFQVLLTRREGTSGRSAGDFDITFNYDRIQWESGDDSGGEGGLGGSSAAVGLTNGSGEDGTHFQLPGSLTPGAFVDGGPRALVSGAQSSPQTGRYVFEVRNDGLVSSLGNLIGTVVKDSDSSPVSGARVQACLTSFDRCYYGETNGSGGYTFGGVKAGTYDLTVWPDTTALFSGGASDQVVTVGDTTAVPTIRLSAPLPAPTTVTVNGQTGTGTGVPSVVYSDPINLSLTGCAATASPTWTARMANGEFVGSGAMTENPAGTYKASIPPFGIGNTGSAVITTNVPATCGGEPTTFNIYIDPSGIVTDQYGRPIQGATVTLLRSDTVDGDYTVVPDGSDIMSPSNRANPSTTDPTGYFRWDVVSGFYKVTATKAGCTPVTTDSMEVPPERIDLVIKMQCTVPAPTPSAVPTIVGSGRVGETLSVTTGTWTSPIAHQGFQWMNNGVAISGATGSTYVPTVADHGDTLTVVESAGRPPYVQEGGTGAEVTFTQVSATSAGRTVSDGVAATNTGAPTVTGTRQVDNVLTATPGTWNPTSGLTFSYQWLRNGTAIPGATQDTYTLAPADADQQIAVRVRAARTGYETGTADSTASTVAKGTAATNTGAPTYSGTVKVGQVLTAASGTWTPSSGLTFTYQWMRAGAAIPGATGSQYTVSVADIGKLLTVRVLATRTGYADGAASAVGMTVPRLTSTTTAKLVKAKVPASKRGKVTVTVKSLPITQPTGKIQVLVDRKVKVTVTLTAAKNGKITITLPKLKKGKHKVQAKYLGNGTTINKSSSKVVTITIT